MLLSQTGMEGSLAPESLWPKRPPFPPQAQDRAGQDTQWREGTRRTNSHRQALTRAVAAAQRAGAQPSLRPPRPGPQSPAAASPSAGPGARRAGHQASGLGTGAARARMSLRR